MEEMEIKMRKENKKYMTKKTLDVSWVVTTALDGIIIRTLIFTSVSTSTGPVLKGNLNGVCVMA